jgi:Xaa-Pro aminopeptidase
MSENKKDLDKELPKIDPEKLFDESQYNTIKIGGDTDSPIGEAGEKDVPAKDLVSLLASKTIGEKDKALDLLKKEKAVTLLVDAVKNCKNPKDRALLVAACWESGMSFKAHLEFFAELVHDADLFVSLEAITVVSENIGEVDKTQAEQLISILSKAADDHFNAALIQDAIGALKGVD